MASPKHTVAIIGSGMTGLLVAQGLKKNGFDVAVFDREAYMDYRTRDWTVVLHWALPIMKTLLPQSVVDKIPTAVCNPHLTFDETTESVTGYSAATGAVMFHNKVPGSRRISRQRLRKVLAEGIDVQFGKDLVAIDGLSDADSGPAAGPAVLRFADGTTFAADYVLGCDGSGSKVRELLLGAEKAQRQGSGNMFCSCVCEYHDADRVASLVALHPVTSLILGADTVAALSVMQVDEEAPADMSRWSTMWMKIWALAGDDEASQDKARKEAQGLKGQAAIDYVQAQPRVPWETFQSFIDATPKGSDCYINEMTYWVPVEFDNHGGRVTLAGDAAHPMLVYRGQGYQHAVVDANNYVDAMKKIRESGWTAEARKEAVDAYDADMIPRGAKAVLQSVSEAKLTFSNKTGDMMMVRQGHGRSA